MTTNLFGRKVAALGPDTGIPEKKGPYFIGLCPSSENPDPAASGFHLTHRTSLDKLRIGSEQGRTRANT